MIPAGDLTEGSLCAGRRSKPYGNVSHCRPHCCSAAHPRWYGFFGRSVWIRVSICTAAPFLSFLHPLSCDFPFHSLEQVSQTLRRAKRSVTGPRRPVLKLPLFRQKHILHEKPKPSLSENKRKKGPQGVLCSSIVYPSQVRHEPAVNTEQSKG